MKYIILLLAIAACSKEEPPKKTYQGGIVINSHCGTYKNVEIDCSPRYIPSYTPEKKYQLSPEQIKKACMKWIDQNKSMQKVGYSCCQMNGGPMVIQGAFSGGIPK